MRIKILLDVLFARVYGHCVVMLLLLDHAGCWNPGSCFGGSSFILEAHTQNITR